MSTVFVRGRWGRPARLLAVGAATALAVTVPVTPAASAPEPRLAAQPYDRGSAGDALETVAQTYLANHPGLTAATARAAAVAQATAGEALKTELAKRWDTFGGGWFDPMTATYHLAVTSPAAGRVLAETGAARGVVVETPLVGRSLDALYAQVKAVRSSTGPLAQAAGDRVGIDVTTNQVLAAVPPAHVAALAAQAPAGVRVVPAIPLDVEADACTDRQNCDNFLAAGLMLGVSTRADNQICSLGFTARNAAGVRVTLTAGHCSSSGQTWYNGNSTVRVVGTVGRRINNAEIDATEIVSTNPFYGNVNNGRLYFSPPATTRPITGESFLLVGDTACLSASFQDPDRIGNPCAEVGSISDPFNRGLVRIDGYDSCPGDSGGGWYWLPGNGNRYAVALHSRSSPGCNMAPLRSWASSLSVFFPDLVYETSS